MDREELKKLISAYADGEAGPEDIARAVEAIKSDREYRMFQREIRKLKREFKRLHNPVAFAVFQKAWRERLNIRTKKAFSGWRMPVNAAVLTALAVVIVFGGLYVRNQWTGKNAVEMEMSADSATFEQGEPELMMQEAVPEAAMAEESTMAESAMAEAEEESAGVARKGFGQYSLPISVKDEFINKLTPITESYTVESSDKSETLTVELVPEEFEDFISLADDYGLVVEPSDLEGQPIIIIFQ